MSKEDLRKGDSTCQGNFCDLPKSFLLQKKRKNFSIYVTKLSLFELIYSLYNKKQFTSQCQVRHSTETFSITPLCLSQYLFF